MKTPDWKLERYLLDELEEDFTPNKEELLRIEELKNQSIKFLEANPYTSFEKKLEKENIFSKILKTLIVPKYALGLSMVLVLALGLFFKQEALIEDNRVKGNLDKLYIYKNIDEKGVEIFKDSTLKTGDQIQLALMVSSYKYAMVFSVDGALNIALHYPENGQNTAPELEKNVKINLSSSYKLDDSKDYEKFYLVISNNKFIILETIDAVINHEMTDTSMVVKEYSFKKN